MKTKWLIDTGHSQVQFKVKHLALANVSGTFKIFQGGTETVDDDFDKAIIHFELDSSSVDTNNTERDNHLKSELFLNAAKFPKIIFKGLLQKEDGDSVLKGNLTILEATNPVTLNVEHTGSGIGRFNDTRAGFEVSGKINRRDFGLNFNLATDIGNLVVGEEIKITCDIELIKQLE